MSDMDPGKIVQYLRAVLFDLDDTLYDREAVFLRWAYCFVQERLGLETDGERRNAVARIVALDPDGYGSKQSSFLRLNALFPGLGFGGEAFAARCFEEFTAQVTPEPGMDGLLHTLENADVPFGIVTNGLERQRQKIERLGLRDRTPCLFISGTFGARKPDTAIFLAAAECLNVRPDEIVFVGDNPVNDILGAHRAGMKTAWLHRGKPWPDTLADLSPDYTIERLEDVLRCFSSE